MLSDMSSSVYRLSPNGGNTAKKTAIMEYVPCKLSPHFLYSSLVITIAYSNNFQLIIRNTTIHMANFDCVYWGRQLTALRLDGLIHCRDDKETNPLVAHGCLDKMFSFAVPSVYLIV